MKQTTILAELLKKVLLTLAIAFVLLAGLNYFNIQRFLDTEHLQNRSLLIKEIQNIISYQDFTLGVIEKNIERRSREISAELLSKYLNKNNNLNSVDLEVLADSIDLKDKWEDLYLIDLQSGKIVSTTYKNDLGLNVFNFGESFKNFLLKIAREGSFASERFSYETSTGRIRKYSYQPTSNKKYILEIGIYSDEVDSSMKMVNKFMNAIREQDPSLLQIDLFVDALTPFNLNTGKVIEKQDVRYPYLLGAFKKQTDSAVTVNFGGSNCQLELLFMKRKNTSLYQNSIITTLHDPSYVHKQITLELLKIVLVFGFVLLVIVLLISKIARRITNPIKNLAEKAVSVKEGNFSERATISGNNELTILSENFNTMLATIEGYYVQLEDKVKERTQEIMDQKVEIESQKHRITDSINYAKYIQDSILPTFRYIKQFIPDMFVLFKPRDIVSGDFYWVHNQGNKTFFAVVDCTGHGVPGAFMSMVAHTLLNEIVKQSKVYQPAEILMLLNQFVIKTLNQVECEQDDGMDISLCCIDKENKTIEIAAANHNALFILNGKSNVLEGDYHSIGGVLSIRNEVRFDVKKFEIAPNDVAYVYMFSDGFADQIGSSRGVKYGTTALINKINENYNLPMLDQKRLLENELANWQGDQKQVDDILLVGLKITM